MSKGFLYPNISPILNGPPFPQLHRFRVYMYGTLCVQCNHTPKMNHHKATVNGKRVSGQGFLLVLVREIIIIIIVTSYPTYLVADVQPLLLVSSIKQTYSQRSHTPNHCNFGGAAYVIMT